MQHTVYVVYNSVNQKKFKFNERMYLYALFRKKETYLIR